MDKQVKVLIIGGGASGLMAAVAARRNGARVIILERMDRVGKKILATGNGRCNLTNTNMDFGRFHSAHPKFITGALTRLDVNQTLDLFEQMGIAYKVEDEGKVFPMSEQASSVLDVLRYEIEQLDVEVLCEAEVTKIQKKKNKFTLSLKDGRKISGEKVILASGGKSASNLGSNGSGYDLVAPFGHTIVNPFPALVQLVLEGWFLKRLKGVKFKGKVSIGDHKNDLQTEFGEILFTEYGISGPPILQLSRKAGELLQNKNANPFISLDILPQWSENELDIIICTRFSYHPEKSIEFCFVGMINKRLIPVILKEAGIEDLNITCAKISTNERKNIVKILKNWQIPVKGTRSFKESQVTAGGINVKDIDPNTMESKRVPGLFFAGEVVDVDGDCGGFNLQWAWSSGYIAGEYASK